MPSAWREIDEISNYYIQKVGKQAAKRLFENLMKSIERLKMFPKSAPLIRDEKLSSEGYRILISGEYICIYRVINKIVYIYHIANGRTEYKNLITYDQAVNILKTHSEFIIKPSIDSGCGKGVMRVKCEGLHDNQLK